MLQRSWTLQREHQWATCGTGLAPGTLLLVDATKPLLALPCPYSPPTASADQAQPGLTVVTGKYAAQSVGEHYTRCRVRHGEPDLPGSNYRPRQPLQRRADLLSLPATPPRGHVRPARPARIRRPRAGDLQLDQASPPLPDVGAAYCRQMPSAPRPCRPGNPNPSSAWVSLVHVFHQFARIAESE